MSIHVLTSNWSCASNYKELWDYGILNTFECALSNQHLKHNTNNKRRSKTFYSHTNKLRMQTKACCTD